MSELGEAKQGQLYCLIKLGVGMRDIRDKQFSKSQITQFKDIVYVMLHLLHNLNVSMKKIEQCVVASLCGGEWPAA